VLRGADGTVLREARGSNVPQLAGEPLDTRRASATALRRAKVCLGQRANGRSARFVFLAGWPMTRNCKERSEE
jgi:hypothetical protein